MTRELIRKLSSCALSGIPRLRNSSIASSVLREVFRMGTAWRTSWRIRSSTRSRRAWSRLKSPLTRMNRARLMEYSTETRRTRSAPTVS